jgi:hypothetical protein
MAGSTAAESAAATVSRAGDSLPAHAPTSMSARANAIELRMHDPPCKCIAALDDWRLRWGIPDLEIGIIVYEVMDDEVK